MTHQAGQILDSREFFHGLAAEELRRYRAHIGCVASGRDATHRAYPELISRGMIRLIQTDDIAVRAPAKRVVLRHIELLEERAT